VNFYRRNLRVVGFVEGAAVLTIGAGGAGASGSELSAITSGTATASCKFFITARPSRWACRKPSEPSSTLTLRIKVLASSDFFCRQVMTNKAKPRSSYERPSASFCKCCRNCSSTRASFTPLLPVFLPRSCDATTRAFRYHSETLAPSFLVYHTHSVGPRKFPCRPASVAHARGQSAPVLYALAATDDYSSTPQATSDLHHQSGWELENTSSAVSSFVWLLQYPQRSPSPSPKPIPCALGFSWRLAVTPVPRRSVFSAALRSA